MLYGDFSLIDGQTDGQTDFITDPLMNEWKNEILWKTGR